MTMLEFVGHFELVGGKAGGGNCVRNVVVQLGNGKRCEKKNCHAACDSYFLVE